MRRHECTATGEIARRACAPCEHGDLGRASDHIYCFRRLGRSTGPTLAFSIEHDDFFVTVRIDTDGIEGTSLLASVSPRSVLLFISPSEQEIKDDRDLAADDILRFISIPVEIDPERAETSLRDSQLVLVLPVSSATPRSA